MTKASCVIAFILSVIAILVGLFTGWFMQLCFAIALYFFISYVINKDVTGGYFDLSFLEDLIWVIPIVFLMLIASTIALKFNIPQLAFDFILHTK